MIPHWKDNSQSQVKKLLEYIIIACNVMLWMGWIKDKIRKNRESNAIKVAEMERYDEKLLGFED